MKNILTVSITITCLLALALPAFAGDGGPLPVCPPGTDCSVRLPDGSLSNRPLCCSFQPPSIDRTFGDINVQDRMLAQFSTASPKSLLGTNGERTDTKSQQSSAASIPNLVSLRVR